MPNMRPSGEPVPIPKTAKANGRLPDDTLPVSTNTNNHCHGHSDIERTASLSLSESDSFPESAYVNPFSPGAGNHWGTISVPHKPVTLTVDNIEDSDLGMDSLNLGDERDLGHRLEGFTPTFSLFINIV